MRMYNSTILSVLRFQNQMQEIQKSVNDPSFQRALRNYQSAAQRLSEMAEVQRSTARMVSDLAPILRDFQRLVTPDVFARLEGGPTSLPSHEYEPKTAEPAPLVPPESGESESGWIAEEFFATLFLNIRYGHREYTGDLVHPRRAIG